MCSRLVIAIALLLVTVPVDADPKSDAVVEARLKRARDTYASVVDAAKRRLREEYDSAVQACTRAGNLDQALALRKSRDQIVASTTQPSFIEAERPDVEEGWTILFRSADPLVWNLAVRNRTMAAVPVTAAPAKVQFLRMRRMDTGDSVIVPATNDQLSTRTWPVDRPTFRGDRCLSRGGRSLGIVDTRAARDVNTTPVIDVTPNGPYAGWGFATWETGQGTGQDYVWDSKVIPATTFEIAVTDRPLSAEEQKLLVKR